MFWDIDCGDYLSSVDIKSWSDLRGVAVRKWELIALREMDAARSEWRRKPEGERKMMPATADNLLTALRSKASGDPKKQLRKK